MSDQQNYRETGMFKKRMLRPGKGVFCLVTVGGILMTVAMLMLKQPPTVPLPLNTRSQEDPSAFPVRMQGLLSSRNQVRPHPQDPAHQPFPVPARPLKGAVPPYPVPDDLRENALFGAGGVGGGGGTGGGGGGGLLGPGQQGQGLIGGTNQGEGLFMENGNSLLAKSGPAVGLEEKETPLKIAERLWDLIVAPKEVLSDGDQQGAPSGCRAKHHIFFGKVHKTGSSTVANILQRYGFRRDLNFLLPRKRLASMSYNYISMPGQSPSRSLLMPHPLGGHYDLMWCHAIYHRAFYHSVMPEDTVFVTILRHPLEQFVSAFEYYGRMPGSYLNTIYQVNASNPLSAYLQEPARFEDPRRLTSYIRNKQSQDLGMTAEHVKNDTLRHRYIHQLGYDFHLVMITEFFDESLVLLRRLMCWSLRDILYIPKNRNSFKQKRTFSPEDLQRHRQLNVADFDLYNFFHDRFRQTLREQGPDFQQEVQMLKGLLRRVQLYCGRWSHSNNIPFRVPVTRWSPAFVLTSYDCVLMQKQELPFLNDLMMDAVRKYQRSAVQNFHS